MFPGEMFTIVGLLEEVRFFCYYNTLNQIWIGTRRKQS